LGSQGIFAVGYGLSQGSWIFLKSLVTTQPCRAAGFESLPSAASEEFFLRFENAQRFQISKSPSLQAAKPRFIKKPLRLSNYKACSFHGVDFEKAVVVRFQS